MLLPPGAGSARAQARQSAQELMQCMATKHKRWCVSLEMELMVTLRFQVTMRQSTGGWRGGGAADGCTRRASVAGSTQGAFLSTRGRAQRKMKIFAANTEDCKLPLKRKSEG